jgi:uncharacterized protein (UPF0332 family)
VKPETEAFLRKARELRDEAQTALSVSMLDHAGRASYLAGFHAAQALLFERMGRNAKTHSGVQTLLARLVKDDPHFDSELRGFLSRAYNLKAMADYETGPGSHVTPDQAATSIAAATRFVAAVTALIEID